MVRKYSSTTIVAAVFCVSSPKIQHQVLVVEFGHGIEIVVVIQIVLGQQFHHGFRTPRKFRAFGIGRHGRNPVWYHQRAVFIQDNEQRDGQPLTATVQIAQLVQQRRLKAEAVPRHVGRVLVVRVLRLVERDKDQFEIVITVGFEFFVERFQYGAEAGAGCVEREGVVREESSVPNTKLAASLVLTRTPRSAEVEQDNLVGQNILGFAVGVLGGRPELRFRAQLLQEAVVAAGGRHGELGDSIFVVCIRLCLQCGRDKRPDVPVVSRRSRLNRSRFRIHV